MRRHSLAEMEIVKGLRGRFAPLLVALVMLILTAPLAVPREFDRLVINVCMCGVLVVSLYAAWPSRRALLVGCTMSFVDISVNGLTQVVDQPWLIVVQNLSWIATLSAIGIALLESILRARRVTGDTLFAAFCFYLLMGIAWAYFYALVEFAIPGSFVRDPAPLDLWRDAAWRRSEFMHLFSYSFGTLAFTGYDGIRAPTPFAHLLACFEAIASQMFLAVFIARLVGMAFVEDRDEAATAVVAGAPADGADG